MAKLLQLQYVDTVSGYCDFTFNLDLIRSYSISDLEVTLTFNDNTTQVLHFAIEDSLDQFYSSLIDTVNDVPNYNFCCLCGELVDSE